MTDDQTTEELQAELARSIDREALDADDREALAAIARVQKHLRDAWIVDECRERPSIGCASCEMIDLERRLEMLATEIKENAGITE